MVGNVKVGDWLDAHEDVIKGYGFKKTASDADIVLGSNKAMRKAMRDAQTNEEKQTATDKFIAGFEKSDVAKINLNNIFNPDTENGEAENPFRKYLANSLVTTAPHLSSGAMSKMKGSTKDNFVGDYTKEIKSEYSGSSNLVAIDKAEEGIEALKKQKEADPNISRLKDELEQVKKLQGSEAYKAEQIKKKNDQIAQIIQQFDQQIENLKSKQKNLRDNLTQREKNIQSAADTFKKALDANATFGGGEPATAPK
jgi:hypothetical protein